MHASSKLQEYYMYKNHRALALFMLLLSTLTKSYTSDISEYEVRNLAQSAVKNYFAKNSWFGGHHNPERLDLAETEKIIAEYALKKCFRNYSNSYGKTCSKIKIAERLADRITHRVEEITRNKVNGVALWEDSRTYLVLDVSKKIEAELSGSINTSTGEVTWAGFENLVRPYLYLEKKDALDQKIEVMLQQDPNFQQALKRKHIQTAQSLPSYEQVDQNRQQYLPSAPRLPSYEEAVQQTVVLPRCNHPIDQTTLATLFDSAQQAGKLVSCPTCGKQQYRDDITKILRK